MKRDWNLIRQLLLNVESGIFKEVVDGYTEYQVRYHYWLLGDSGLMNVIDISLADSPLPQASPRALTSAGQDFVNLARNEVIWMQAMNKAATVGGSVPFDILKSLLADMVAKEFVR